MRQLWRGWWRCRASGAGPPRFTRCLPWARADVFAAGDLALQEGARVLFGLEDRPSEKALRVMAEAWSPWRAVAARILWAYYHVAKSREGHQMTRELQFGRRASVSGKTRSLVVFLHGYGADGADLLDLAGALGPHLQDTVFVAPDAPDACAGKPVWQAMVQHSAL